MSAASALAHLWVDRGNYKNAEAIIRPTLKRRRRDLGDEHPDTLVSMVALGALLSRMGQHEEARNLLENALATR
eukprot:SAG11_NODE_14067_length_626_cov_1.438330_1_plen_73_part_10